MSQQEANEQARRNYAMEAYTLGEENFLQIRCGGQVIATVCEPEGPGMVDQFNVYNGTGLNDEDEMDESLVAKVFEVDISTDRTWREAVRFAYCHALAVMIAQDAREARGQLSRAA